MSTFIERQSTFGVTSPNSSVSGVNEVETPKRIQEGGLTNSAYLSLTTKKVHTFSRRNGVDGVSPEIPIFLWVGNLYLLDR